MVAAARNLYARRNAARAKVVREAGGRLLCPSRFALHNHLAIWPLWPVRVRWLYNRTAARAYRRTMGRMATPAGFIHWVELGVAQDGRDVYATVVHFGWLKCIFGALPW